MTYDMLTLEGSQEERRAIVAENRRRSGLNRLTTEVPARTRNEHIEAAGRYIELETSPSNKGYGSSREIRNAELRIEGTYKRCGISLILEGEEGRQDEGGPMVPGPWAATYGLATCIASSRLARKPEVIVTDGDVICIPHRHGDSAYTYYRVRVYRREYLALDRIEADGTLTPAGWRF